MSHSPIEKECFLRSLRGPQPVIVCPARDINGMRIAGEGESLYTLDEEASASLIALGARPVGPEEVAGW